MTAVDAATELELLGAGSDVSHETSHLNESELLDDSCQPKATVKSEDADLYDDAIAPTGSGDNKTEPGSVVRTQSVTVVANQSNGTDKRHSCYVGNMTWWTTDADLMVHFQNLGVTDTVETRFFENRINGQSKGYALCSFISDQSIRTLMEKMPTHPVHGANLIIMPYTKQSLAKLEEAVAKTHTRPDQKIAPKKEDGVLDMGTIRIGAGGPMSGTGMMMRASTQQMSAPTLTGITRGPVMQTMQPQPLMTRPLGPPGVQQVPPGVSGHPGVASMPPIQVNLTLPPGVPRTVIAAPQGMMNVPPQNMMTGPPGVGRPPGLPYMQAPGMQSLMQHQLRPPGMPMGPNMPPPGAHVNPQIFPGMGQPSIPEGEFEEIMNRNRTVSSSAISRAVADASQGDVKSATETLLTAISLIKQSRVAGDDRCRLLIGSLQDTLSGIEAKAYGNGRSKRHDRDRSRSRDRDRERKRRRRSRSTSRSRSPRHRRY